MPVTTEERQALLGAFKAQGQAANSIGMLQIALLDGDTDSARALAAAANDSTQRCARLLRLAGISAPVAAATAFPGSDFAGLAQLDTPDSRELLRLLREAQAVAERVDAGRGRSLPLDIPLQPGEAHGTDLAESISEIALRVRIEVEGPKGKE